MKRAIVILAALAALASVAQAQQATVFSVPLWTGRTYTWPTLGPTLVVRDGQLDVLPPPPQVQKVRKYSVLCAAVPCPLPAGASNVAVHLNGLRQAPGIDYTIEAGAVKPLWIWPAERILLVDYDE